MNSTTSFTFLQSGDFTEKNCMALVGGKGEMRDLVKALSKEKQELADKYTLELEIIKTRRAFFSNLDFFGKEEARPVVSKGPCQQKAVMRVEK